MKVQSSLIKDTIDLYQGNVLQKSIPFTFNATKSLQEVQRKRAEILKKHGKSDLEGTGKAFYELLVIIFGQDVVTELDDWYKGDYLTMLNDIAPILTDTIYPVIDEMTENLVKSRKRLKA